VQSLDRIPEKLRGVFRNSGGGYVNHELFWYEPHDLFEAIGHCVHYCAISVRIKRVTLCYAPQECDGPACGRPAHWPHC
jgi:hypothetical protein